MPQEIVPPPSCHKCEERKAKEEVQTRTVAYIALVMAFISLFF